MKHLRVLLFLAIGVALVIPGWARADADQALPASATLTAIDNARVAGQITEPQAMLYKLYAVFGSSKLPQQFQVEGAPPVKCATWVVQDVKRHLGAMPDQMRQEAETFFARPNLNASIDTQHYRIHYSTSGNNMIYGWPNTAFRDSIAGTCERSWNFYHVTQGWPVPPGDGGAGGGNNLIDCYVDDLGTQVLGVTFAETPGGNYQNSYIAYFEIQNNFLKFPQYHDNYLPMDVTVAHEYHHVVQMGLNATSSPPFMENTSTEMEEQVYPMFHDNWGYIPLTLSRPWLNLLYTHDGSWEYGAYIWPNYLVQNWTWHVLHDIWVEFATNLVLTSCIDDQLAPFGYTCNKAIAEWARWNIFTYQRDDGHHYQYGANWQTYVNPDHTVNTYPVTNLHPDPTKKPAGAATDYTYFLKQTGSTDNKISVTFQALSPCDYNHVISFVRKFQGQQVWEEYVVPVDGSGNASFDLLQWDQTEYMFMVAEMKIGCGTSGKDFQFSAATSQVSAVDDIATLRPVRVLKNDPNPFRGGTTIQYALGVSGPVRVDVMDANGRRLQTLVDQTQPAGAHQVRWLGTDASGRTLAPGVYFCSVAAGNERVTRKMIMVE